MGLEFFRERPGSNSLRGSHAALDTLSKLAHGLDISLRTLFSTFEQRKRDDVAELADYLSKRSSKDARLVARLVKVLFEP